MDPVCSFCGDRPVAWFEGPSFRNAVDSADKVSADVAWLACATCLRLVESNDREGLVQRNMAYQRRKDAEKGVKRSTREGTEMRRASRSHFENVFWVDRSE